MPMKCTSAILRRSSSPSSAPASTSTCVYPADRNTSTAEGWMPSSNRNLILLLSREVLAMACKLRGNENTQAARAAGQERGSLCNAQIPVGIHAIARGGPCIPPPRPDVCHNTVMPVTQFVTQAPRGLPRCCAFCSVRERHIPVTERDHHRRFPAYRLSTRSIHADQTLGAGRRSGRHQPGRTSSNRDPVVALHDGCQQRVGQ